jgi:2-oxo-4-hydroxy-4-carboxy-5-ureidoimidazoline decarboxylase
MISVAAVNALTVEAFVEAFGDIAEHSPWVALGAAGTRPFADREAMVAAFVDAMSAAPEAAQLALVRAHPDLATRARLTDDSRREQAGAGLDTLNAEEFARFTHLNELYKAKFDFPFIFAVKGATKHQIIRSFATRLNNSPEDEFAMALMQIGRILRFRIEDRVMP